MKIRGKLLILLLAISLAPLIVAEALHRVSTRRLGSDLASNSRQMLTEKAGTQLQDLVNNYERILNRDQQILELSLKIQANEVQGRLAGEVPENPAIFLSKDYDEGTNLPSGMQASEKHFRPDEEGKLAPIQVTYDQQVFFIAEGVDPEKIAAEMARLSTMPQVYRSLYQQRPKIMYWQYTSMESGFHTSYPGHGGYPEDYDHRKRKWYNWAKQAGELTWLPPLTEVSTQTIQLGLAMPVYYPGGEFAGVTAIDVPLLSVLEEIKLPRQWAQDAWIMHVIPGDEETGTLGQLIVLADRSYHGRSEHWRLHPEWKQLKADNEAGLEELKTLAMGGESGVMRMPYQGRDAFWAFGAGKADQEAFPIVIIPYDLIVAEANSTEQYVWGRTIQGLKNTGFVMLSVFVTVLFVAMVTSRRVTEPIRQVTQAGRKLARGDYDVSVDIRTGDELQELGEVFNDTGPKLREREKMKRSLELAMEVQQNLLPEGPPKLKGFDIAGKSVYCDETGGDYYDFIDVVELGENKLGVAVGDITGHGIGAALLMASARGVLRSHAGRYGTNLGELFNALNIHLVRDTGEARFLTLFYGIIDADQNTFCWASGGHDPPYWLQRKTSQIDELESPGGIPLGILEEATYSQGGPVELSSGDVIVIGTDGIWEAANPAGEMFGKARLKDVLKVNQDESAEEIRTAIIDSVAEFRQTAPQLDDITLVVIKAE